MRLGPNKCWPTRVPALREHRGHARLPDRPIAIHLTVRREEDGTWRAKLRFVDPDFVARETVEIFCAPSEAELWESVRSLPEHHLRALYLSLA